MIKYIEWISELKTENINFEILINTFIPNKNLLFSNIKLWFSYLIDYIYKYNYNTSYDYKLDIMQKLYDLEKFNYHDYNKLLLIKLECEKLNEKNKCILCKYIFINNSNICEYCIKKLNENIKLFNKLVNKNINFNYYLRNNEIFYINEKIFFEEFIMSIYYDKFNKVIFDTELQFKNLKLVLSKKQFNMLHHIYGICDVLYEKSKCIICSDTISTTKNAFCNNCNQIYDTNDYEKYDITCDCESNISCNCESNISCNCESNISYDSEYRVSNKSTKRKFEFDDNLFDLKK